MTTALAFYGIAWMTYSAYRSTQTMKRLRRIEDIQSELILQAIYGQEEKVDD